MEWGQLLSIALTVTTLGTLTGLGLLRGTVTNLREQLRDERDLTASLRTRHAEDIAEAQQQRTEDRSKIDQLKTDLDALGRVVTGEAHWIAIGQQLDTHHEATEDHWRRAHEHWTRELEVLSDAVAYLKGRDNG